MNFIIDEIGEAACLEQLAEEAAELAQAALKMARIIRGENPTPLTKENGLKALKEEIADVRVCLRVLQENQFDFSDTTDLEATKFKRWIRRLQGIRTVGEDA